MFQNIARDFEENQNSYEDVELNKKEKIKVDFNYNAEMPTSVKKSAGTAQRI